MAKLHRKNKYRLFWKHIVRKFKLTLRYGGEIKAESAMEFDADIGPLVVHKYTVTNKGPWSVSNVTLQVGIIDYFHKV